MRLFIQTDRVDTFFVYLGLGIDHLLSWDAGDHLFFLLALLAPYTLRDWKQILSQVTGFTAGHCLTLVLSTYALVAFPAVWVERCIPVTIVLAAIGVVLQVKRAIPNTAGFSFSVALLFGCIHGLGFAGTLRSMLGKEADVLLPLAGFNLGLELAQLGVVSLILLFRYALERFLVKELPFTLASALVAGAGGLVLLLDRL